MSDIEQFASQIRAFEETVDEPDNWRIVIPVDEYDAVKGELDAEYDRGSHFNGISLVYADHVEEPRVEYKALISNHLSSLNGDRDV